MPRFALTTLVVSAALPFAPVLAQTAAPSQVAPAAPGSTRPPTLPLLGTAPTLAPVGPPVSTPVIPQPRRPAAAPTQPRAAAAVTIINKRKTAVATVTLTAEAKTVRHAGPLAPNAQVRLKLPKMKGCLVTVAAASQGGKVSKLGDVDVCKERLVRLTE